MSTLDKVFMRIAHLGGYGLLFMILCQLLNGIVGKHTIVDIVLGILFVWIGDSYRKCKE